MRKDNSVDQKKVPFCRKLILFIECSNKVLACLTFFTTQKGSSFFFEYILITAVTCLVPLYDLKSIIRNVIINVCTVLFLTRFTHAIAWQDWVDFFALQIFCVAITQLRWNSYVKYERLSIRLTRDEENAELKARTDILTGLLKRTALRDDFTGFLTKDLNVSLMDIDSFKQLNDTFGHAHGDEVLSIVGQEIRNAFSRNEDHCYRYGGDEFLIISENETTASFAQRLHSLREHCHSASGFNRTDLSIGYTNGTLQTEEDLRTMIRTADHWLYEAKQSQADRIQGGKTPESAKKKEENEGIAATSVTLEMLEKEYRFSNYSRTLIYFDIRQFAEINAHLGRYQGNRILNETMRTLCECFGYDHTVHMDPDMFLVYTSMELDQAIELARRAQRDVSELISYINIILCAGIYSSGAEEQEEDFLTAMDYARYACTQAANEVSGTRYLCLFDEKMRQSKDMGMFIRNHLEEALENRQIIPYYQPLVGSISEKTCGFEALARWKDPQKGMIPPADFIPWLEELHLAYKLDLYMLRMVCEDIQKRWIEDQGDVFVTLNLSRTDFIACDMADEIEKILSYYALPKNRIQFEVTESALTDIDIIQTALHKLENKGYSLWIDDFGNGQSSLSGIQEIHVHGIKLDQAFFRNFREGSRQDVVISSSAELCHCSKLMIIAEGVETEKELWYARNWGVNFIQGYYYSRPLPLDTLLASPFVKNLTTRELNDYYQPANWISLILPLEQKYYAPERRHLVLYKAVMERVREKISILRISDIMHDGVQSCAELEETCSHLTGNPAFCKLVLKQMGRAEQKKDVIDFQIPIDRKIYHGMIVFLSEYQNRKLYVFSFTNFDTVNTQGEASVKS